MNKKSIKSDNQFLNDDQYLNVILKVIARFQPTFGGYTSNMKRKQILLKSMFLSKKVADDIITRNEYITFEDVFNLLFRHRLYLQYSAIKKFQNSK